MSSEQLLAVGKLIIELIQVIIWPLIVLVVLLYFGKSLRKFADSLGEFTFKVLGVEATAKRQQIEAAAYLGAAVASRPKIADGKKQPPGEAAREIAGVVAEAVTSGDARRLSEARVLWVDDCPEYQVFERQALEALGLRFQLSDTTEEALEKTQLSRYDVIISDMGRPPDLRAGYTLLNALRKRGDQTPFIIYSAGGSLPENKTEAKKHGALGSTDRAQELFQLVLSAITEKHG